MRSLKLILPLALVLGLSWAAHATVTSYPVYHPAVAPQLDGDVAGDPAWQTIPEATGFRALGGDYAQAKQTAVRMCWDQAGLYVAFVAEEPDVAVMKPAVRDGGPTWTEDSTEIFMQPRPPAGQTYQIGVTAGGARAAGEGFPDVAKIRVAAKLGVANYALEILIPWAVLDCTPKAGDTWRGTVCRNIFTTQSGGDKFSSMSPLQSRFLEPENFTALVFQAKTLDAAAATQANAALNHDYRTALLAGVLNLADLGKTYEPALRGALKDEKYGAQARQLLRGWRQVARLAARKDAAPVPELRQALQVNRELPQQSYDLKYRILLRQLLLD